MFTIFDLVEIIKLVLRFLISFSFFIGIVLIVSPEAFDALNKALSKEYGIKTRFIPRMELKAIHILDKIITNNRAYGIIAGILIAVISFVLLLINK